MIVKLPRSDGYSKFAYQVALLKEFVRDDENKDSSFRRRIGNNSFRGNNGLDSSVHSAGSLRGRGNNSSSVGFQSSSVHGSGNIYKEWAKKGLLKKGKSRSQSGAVLSLPMKPIEANEK
jgi:hypothetical protein